MSIYSCAVCGTYLGKDCPAFRLGIHAECLEATKHLTPADTAAVAVWLGHGATGIERVGIWQG